MTTQRIQEVTKKTVLLDLVEQYPETEEIIRLYDKASGTCMLCHCLFDSIEIIESTYDTDLSQMIDELNLCLKSL